MSQMDWVVDLAGDSKAWLLSVNCLKTLGQYHDASQYHSGNLGKYLFRDARESTMVLTISQWKSRELLV